MAQSTTFMLSKMQSTKWQRNQNTVRFGLDTKQFGPVAHTVIVAILLCVMGLMYLAQVNKTNAYTYPINELENKKSALLSQQQQLKVEAARLAALQTVKNSSVAQAMSEPANTERIR